MKKGMKIGLAVVGAAGLIVTGYFAVKKVKQWVKEVYPEVSPSKKAIIEAGEIVEGFEKGLKSDVNEDSPEKPQEAADEVLDNSDTVTPDDIQKASEELIRPYNATVVRKTDLSKEISDALERKGVRKWSEMDTEDFMMHEVERQLSESRKPTVADAISDFEERMAEEMVSVPRDDDDDVEYYINEFGKTVIDDEEFREVDQLRHDPNSIEAWEQYKGSKMADVFDARSRAWLLILFDYEFVPTFSDDVTVGMHIYDDRKEFFGEGSKYVERFLSMSELIIHFATLYDFDVDKGINFWVNELLNNLGFEDNVSDWTPEEVKRVIHDFNKNELHTERGFGLFGLTPRSKAFMEAGLMNQYWNSEYLDMYGLFESEEDDEYE